MKSWFAVALAVFLGAPGMALGQEDPLFKQLVDEALEHYRAKRYDQAITSFEAAYKIRAEPELMYNIARSHEKALRRDEAIEAYNRFLGLPGTTAELRTNALASMEALERERAAMSKRSAQREAPPAATVAADPALGATTTRRENPAPASARVEASPRAERSRTLEYALLGVGGVAIVAGGVFAGLAFKADSDFDAATVRDQKVQLRDDVKSRALAADLLIGTGVVAAGIGAILLLSADDEPDALTVAPSVGLDGAGVVVAGAF